MMMEPTHERHPLDDGPDDGSSGLGPYEGRDVTKAYRPLLRVSQVVLIASGAVVFLSGVAAGNAPPNSGLEMAASVVNRLSMVVLLCGFVALLVAYRIPHLQSLSLRPPGSSIQGQSWRRRWTAELEILLVANLGAIGLLWIMIIVLPPWWLGIFIAICAALSVIFAGLLVTMAIWHAGALRAYAIGTATAILLELNAGMGMFGAMAFGRGGMGRTGAGISFGIVVSLALLTGVVCATYVTLLTKTRAARESSGRDEPL